MLVEVVHAKKREFTGEIWEGWALTYGRNGSSERKSTPKAATKVLAGEVWIGSTSTRRLTLAVGAEGGRVLGKGAALAQREHLTKQE